jgi:phosphoserine phosphatase
MGVGAGIRKERVRIGLAVFDLDGTLLRGETVCETLAEPLGRSERMRVLEKCQELSDVRLARYEIASWYAGRERAELTSYLAGAKLAPGAVAGCEMLRQEGIVVAIASLTWLFAVEWFASRFGASHWMGSDVVSETEIRHCWPEDKAEFTRRVARSLHAARCGVAAVGDSWGDVELLHAADLPVFVGRERVRGLPAGVVHMPDADIRDVARLILEMDSPGSVQIKR